MPPLLKSKLEHKEGGHACSTLLISTRLAFVLIPPGRNLSVTEQSSRTKIPHRAPKNISGSYIIAPFPRTDAVIFKGLPPCRFLSFCVCSDSCCLCKCLFNCFSFKSAVYITHPQPKSVCKKSFIVIADQSFQTLYSACLLFI